MNTIQMLIQRAIKATSNEELKKENSDLEKENPPVAKGRGSVRMPRRRKNSDSRSREFLTESEVAELQKAVRNGENGLRNSTMILLAFRHGLRVSELISLKWEQVDFVQEFLYVKRMKNGIDSTHPLRETELEALGELREKRGDSMYVFPNVLGKQMTTSNFRKLLDVAAVKAKIMMKIHPHMLRHACGHYLANHGEDTRAIQVYMGHTNIQNTTLYTELSPGRFKEFFNNA